MTFPNIKTLLGHSSKTQAFVGVDNDGVVVIVNEDGSTFAPGVGVVGRLANELRDETGSQDEIRFLTGFSIANDGGGGVFQWSDTPATDDGGIVLNELGFGSTSAGWRRIYSGPINVKWFGAVGDGVADDTIPIQRAFIFANAHAKFAGFDVYSDTDVFLPTGIYKITTTLEKASYIGLIGEGNSTLTAAAGVDILRVGSHFNKIQDICFVGGRRAIVIDGPSVVYGGLLGDPAADSMCGRFNRLTFRYQSGPSIALDLTGSPRGGCAHSIHVNDFTFMGHTLFYGNFDNAVFENGRGNFDTDTLPVTYDNGKRMGLFSNSGILTVINCAFAGQGSGDAPWFDGTGNIRSFGFRRGENSFVTYRVRSTGFTYLGEAIGIDPNQLAQIHSYADVFTNTSHNLIEIYDDFPAIVSIQRPLLAGGPGGSPRQYSTFSDPDVRVWVDSVSCPESEWQQSGLETLLLDLKFESGTCRFFTSADPATAGTDITDRLYSFIHNHPTTVSDVGSVNIWISNGSGLQQELDPTYGTGSIFTGGSLTNDTTLGYTIRTFTSTTAAQTASYFANLLAGTAAWSDGGTFPAVSAGLYTFSCYVRANFCGRINFFRDSGSSATSEQWFDGSANSQEWQRIAFPFWHDGSARNFELLVSAIPGTAGTAGSLTIALPMINQGGKACPYMLPGLLVFNGAGSGDTHRIGNATNYGRDLTGFITHTATSGSVQDAGTLSLPRDGTYIVEAAFLGRKSDGTAHFGGVRRAVFKRESGTTTQLGVTETIGSDQVDAGAAGYLVTIDNSSDVVRFRETADSSSVWQIDWKMSIKVT